MRDFLTGDLFSLAEGEHMSTSILALHGLFVFDDDREKFSLHSFPSQRSRKQTLKISDAESEETIIDGHHRFYKTSSPRTLRSLKKALVTNGIDNRV